MGGAEACTEAANALNPQVESDKPPLAIRLDNSQAPLLAKRKRGSLHLRTGRNHIPAIALQTHREVLGKP